MAFSIDTIITVLGSTILSPFLCWYPFIIRSIIQLGYQVIDPGHVSKEDVVTHFIIQSVAWSSYWSWYLAFSLLVTLFWDTLILDKWIYMRQSRQRHQVSKDKDAVIVTGAGTKDGVGRNVAWWFQSRGFHVFALDIVWEEDNVPEKDGLIPIKYVKCDIRDYQNVKQVYNTINTELEPGIVPSVLINVAGVTHNKTIAELDPDTIKKTVDVNLLGTMWTCKCLVEQVISEEKPFGITIVNMSSVLGIVGPAQLSAYSASKAGVRLFHDTLTHELGEPYYSQTNGSRICRKFPANTLLVIPGQISTQMFKGVSTPSTFLAPVLSSEYVATEIGRAVLTSKTGTLELPFYTRFAFLVWILPGFVVEWIRKVSKMDEKMNSWKGHKQL